MASTIVPDPVIVGSVYECRWSAARYRVTHAEPDCGVVTIERLDGRQGFRVTRFALREDYTPVEVNA